MSARMIDNGTFSSAGVSSGDLSLMSCGVDPFRPDNLLCIPDACEYIIPAKPGILFYYGGVIPSRCKKVENKINRDSRPPDYWFAGKNQRVKDDP